MKHALLVGNDINNINNSESWENLLANIQKFCGVQIENPGYKKPFPLFYEEIFLSAKRSKIQDEFTLKKYIARSIDGIKSNSIHERIRNLTVEDIMTTNYDFTLEGISSPKLTSVMTERKYSIFRQFTSGHQRFWHVHGDTKKPSSITLGFEQYGGQLQTLRNYIATGPIYKNKKFQKQPFLFASGGTQIKSSFHGQTCFSPTTSTFLDWDWILWNQISGGCSRFVQGSSTSEK